VWSAAANVDVVCGGWFAIGERPDELNALDLIHADGTFFSEDEVLEVFKPNSEFGLAPHTAFAQVKVYF
jgi:hypothetical protein